MSTFDFDEVVEQYHLALGEFVKGNPLSTLATLMAIAGHYNSSRIAHDFRRNTIVVYKAASPIKINTKTASFLGPF